MLSNFHTAAAVTKTQKPLFLVDGNVQRQAEHGRDPFRCKSLPESQNQKKVEKSPVNGNGQFLTSTGKLWMYMRVCVYIYTHIHISRIHTRWMIHAYLRWWPEDELNSYFPARNIYIYTRYIQYIYILYIYKYMCVCVVFFLEIYVWTRQLRRAILSANNFFGDLTESKQHQTRRPNGYPLRHRWWNVAWSKVQLRDVWIPAAGQDPITSRLGLFDKGG